MDALFPSTPLLETERLILRAFRVDDLKALTSIWSQEAVVRFIGGKPLTREDTWRKSLAASAQWSLLGFGYWMVDLKAENRLVGQLGFADFKRDMTPGIEGEPEFGYVFDSAVHGRGLALEAGVAALRWSDLHLDAPSVPAIISPENLASIRLAERLGFEREPDTEYRDEKVALFRRARTNG